MCCCPQLLEDGCDALDGVLRMHLSSAAGYYYHLLTHLQRCYHLGLENLLSWGISPHQGEVFLFIDKHGVFFSLSHPCIVMNKFITVLYSTCVQS